MKEKIIKSVVSFLLVGSYFFLPKYGFTAFDGSVCGYGIASHFLYPFSHANIWHLAANVLCLWMLRCPMHLVATYLVAVLCSFLPSFCLYDSIARGGFAALLEPTYGFSGVLFAMVGVSWGRIHRFRDMILRNKWYLFTPAFLPHINFLIHIYCLLFGYLYGSVCCHAMTTLKSKLCAKKSKNS
jgi:membrane associated rhomboid family serine protease